MKARITAQTTRSSLPLYVQEAAAVVARDIAKQMYDDMLDCMNDRFILSLSLALNDRLRYKETGIQSVLSAIQEIIEGYDEQEGDNKLAPLDDIRKINDAMKGELASRGIAFERLRR